jgi:hypothetical protein
LERQLDHGAAMLKSKAGTMKQPEKHMLKIRLSTNNDDTVFVSCDSCDFEMTVTRETIHQSAAEIRSIHDGEVRLFINGKREIHEIVLGVNSVHFLKAWCHNCSWKKTTGLRNITLTQMQHLKEEHNAWSRP